MENTREFIVILDDLRKRAERSGHQIFREDIIEAYKGADFSEEQMKMILEYFEKQGIFVVSREDSGKEKPEDGAEHDAQERLERYLEQIKELGKPEAAQELELFHLAARGDGEAISTLAQAYLEAACDLAGEYENESLFGEELVQEAGMGLMLALDKLERQESLAAYQAFIFNETGKYLEEAARAAAEETRGEGSLVNRVDRLEKAIRQLEEELGHKVSIEELSAYLELPSEQILEVMKLAGDVLKDKE